MPPNTVDLKEWVVVGRDDEDKKGQAKEVPVLMKPKITLKVAHAVGSEGASSIEASLGRSDWEWKPEEDASFAESRSAADPDSSSGNKSSACSEDANSSSSSSSSSSSTSSSGVEVLPKRKAVNAKGTKQPITTPMHRAKKRYTVKTSGRKK